MHDTAPFILRRSCTGPCALLRRCQPHGSAAAQSVEQFYQGRTINFLVASAPGGVNDLMARLIARHWASTFRAIRPSSCRI